MHPVPTLGSHPPDIPITPPAPCPLVPLRAPLLPGPALCSLLPGLAPAPTLFSLQSQTHLACVLESPPLLLLCAHDPRPHPTSSSPRPVPSSHSVLPCCPGPALCSLLSGLAPTPTLFPSPSVSNTLGLCVKVQPTSSPSLVCPPIRTRTLLPVPRALSPDPTSCSLLPGSAPFCLVSRQELPLCFSFSLKHTWFASPHLAPSPVCRGPPPTPYHASCRAEPLPGVTRRGEVHSRCATRPSPKHGARSRRGDPRSTDSHHTRVFLQTLSLGSVCALASFKVPNPLSFSISLPLPPPLPPPRRLLATSLSSSSPDFSGKEGSSPG